MPPSSCQRSPGWRMRARGSWYAASCLGTVQPSRARRSCPLFQVLAGGCTSCLCYPHRYHVGHVDDHAVFFGLVVISRTGQDQTAPGAAARKPSSCWVAVDPDTLKCASSAARQLGWGGDEWRRPGLPQPVRARKPRQPGRNHPGGIAAEGSRPKTGRHGLGWPGRVSVADWKQRQETAMFEVLRCPGHTVAAVRVTSPSAR